MKPYALIFITFLLGTTLIFACTKVAPPCCTCEVPYSETGANTLGCLMDGAPWAVCDVAKNKINLSNNVSQFHGPPRGERWKISTRKDFNGGFEAIYIYIYIYGILIWV